mmetsp:Transcript_131920/g.328990  ORF Transcript_131920/g.328990 Transcript_131920/m.328990 type:complete len:439 (+) Transcript_131920:73-1389(+)
MAVARCAAQGCSFAASEASGGTLCSACGQSAGEPQAIAVLAALEGRVSDATRRRLATDLAAGEAGAVARLGDLVAARAHGGSAPAVVVQPVASAEIGTGSVNLLCEAVSFNGQAVRYQWFKDGILMPRAERPRFSLFGAGPKDVGVYHCVASCGSESVSSHRTEVRLSAAESQRHAQFEMLLCRASEAEASGKLEEALIFLTQALAEACHESELKRADLLCRQAEVLVRLSRWQEAFKVASETVSLSPGLARAHAARGAAALKLGLLAEATSSWETAEILGGVLGASEQVEACRERLNSFFQQHQANREGNSDSRHSDGKDAEDNSHDWEESWQQSGFKGRYPGGFFGDRNGARSSGGRSGSSRGGSGSANVAKFRSHLEKLGLAADAQGGLPSAEVVRKAYRARALEVHPDKPGGSKVAFQELQNAYEELLKALGMA